MVDNDGDLSSDPTILGFVSARVDLLVFFSCLLTTALMGILLPVKELSIFFFSLL
jgi:hypothetical protein